MNFKAQNLQMLLILGFFCRKKLRSSLVFTIISIFKQHPSALLAYHFRIGHLRLADYAHMQQYFRCRLFYWSVALYHCCFVIVACFFLQLGLRLNLLMSFFLKKKFWRTNGKIFHLSVWIFFILSHVKHIVHACNIDKN